MKPNKQEILRTLLRTGLAETSSVSVSKTDRLTETAKLMDLPVSEISSYVKSTLNLITAIELLIDKM